MTPATLTALVQRALLALDLGAELSLTRERAEFIAGYLLPHLTASVEPPPSPRGCTCHACTGGHPASATPYTPDTTASTRQDTLAGHTPTEAGYWTLSTFAYGESSGGRVERVPTGKRFASYSAARRYALANLPPGEPFAIAPTSEPKGGTEGGTE